MGKYLITSIRVCLCVSSLAGSRAGVVLLEQRVHSQPHRGEHRQGPAHHVPQPVHHLQGALEPVSFSHMDAGHFSTSSNVTNIKKENPTLLTS